MYIPIRAPTLCIGQQVRTYLMDVHAHQFVRRVYMHANTRTFYAQGPLYIPKKENTMQSSSTACAL